MQAKIWRINNTPGVTADFTNGSTAMATSAVLNGDTLHFEGSATNYAAFTLNKKLILIGPGYFLTGANSNAGLQANGMEADFGGAYIAFDSTATGSILMGLSDFTFAFGPNNGSAADSISLINCKINSLSSWYTATINTVMDAWQIKKCFFAGGINFSGTNDVMKNLVFTNNIMANGLYLNNTKNFNNLIRNNVLRSTVDIRNAYFANNSINTTPTFISCVIKNNIAVGTYLPVGNGNLNNQSDANVFQGLTGNSHDGQWRLKTSPASPAIGAGESIGGVTPDIGAYGTADPYILSGIPPVPTIYSLIAPASVPSSATNMLINISSKSNK